MMHVVIVKAGGIRPRRRNRTLVSADREVGRRPSRTISASDPKVARREALGASVARSQARRRSGPERDLRPYAAPDPASLLIKPGQGLQVAGHGMTGCPCRPLSGGVFHRGRRAPTTAKRDLTRVRGLLLT